MHVGIQYFPPLRWVRVDAIMRAYINILKKLNFTVYLTCTICKDEFL